MDRRRFLAASATALMATQLKAEGSAAPATTGIKGLKVRFLGTGAADWNGIDERGEHRRLSSVLIDDRILIDFTHDSVDMVPKGIHPEIIFYTHSHNDHYDPEAAVALGVKYVYLSETWFDIARKDFSAAAAKLSRPVPQIIPICIDAPVVLGDITITACPANHATRNIMERALIYLVEKNDVRLLYATDTCGIPAVSAVIAGIDSRPKKPLTALIMEATNGKDYEIDFRLFSHSSVALVKRTVEVLEKYETLDTGGKPVYLTHMARTLHGTQADLDRELPAPLKAAYDGLEVIF